MKLSNNTLTILKNFATINDGIFVKKGNVLTTMSQGNSVYATANIEETFPQDFAIYSLNKFINTLSSIDDPELSFSEDKVFIRRDKTKIDYVLADPSMVKIPKKVAHYDGEVTIDITEAKLNSLLKIASNLNLPDLCVVGDSQKVLVVVNDIKDDATDVCEEDIDVSTDKTFRFVIKRDNIKLIPGDYQVSISSKGVAYFDNKNIDLHYSILLDSKSQFGE